MRICLILSLLLVSIASFAGKRDIGPTKTSKVNYSIGIRVNTIGRGETFVFSLGPGKELTINSNVLVNFPGTYPAGYHYTIRQVSGPRTCRFTPGTTGTVANANIEIQCDGGVADDYALLNGELKAPPGTKIELLNNGVDRLKLTAGNGPTFFCFPKAYMQGSTYNITVSEKPAGMTVTVTGYGGEPNTIFPGSFLKVAADYSFDLVSRSNHDSVLGTFYESWEPCLDKALEDNGRYVVFISQAKGLCGSTGNFRQIFWRDRQTNEIRMISRSPDGQEGNGNSFAPVISVGSMYVAFESYATNLVNDDHNGVRDVFVWRKTQGGGEVERVSVGPGGVEGNSESFEPSISGMGGHVAFSSNATNLTADGIRVDGVNVYLWEKHNKNVTLISKDHQTGKGVGGCKPSIDMNGYKIAFWSYAYTLVPDDKNNLWDIFLYQRNNNLVGLPLKRITMAYDGGERNQGDESSSRVVTPTISGIDGRYITYATTASNVVPDDNNKAQDVFVYDVQTNTTVRASVDNNGVEGNGDSPYGQGEKIDITGNGDIVVFTTKASNFGTPANNVVMYNLQTKKMTPVSSVTGTYVSTPSVSRNGRYVAFGCGRPLDNRFNSSGLFAVFVDTAN